MHWRDPCFPLHRPIFAVPFAFYQRPTFRVLDRDEDLPSRRKRHEAGWTTTTLFSCPSHTTVDPHPRDHHALVDPRKFAYGA